MFQQRDAGVGQLRQHRFVPAAILGGDQFLRPPRDPLKLRDGPHSVGRVILRRAVAERLLAQARHADHEKLVQVRAEDRQELDPLQQRIGRILGLFQHARR